MTGLWEAARAGSRRRSRSDHEHPGSQTLLLPSPHKKQQLVHNFPVSRSVTISCNGRLCGGQQHQRCTAVVQYAHAREEGGTPFLNCDIAPLYMHLCTLYLCTYRKSGEPRPPPDPAASKPSSCCYPAKDECLLACAADEKKHEILTVD